MNMDAADGDRYGKTIQLLAELFQAIQNRSPKTDGAKNHFGPTDLAGVSVKAFMFAGRRSVAVVA